MAGLVPTPTPTPTRTGSSISALIEASLIKYADAAELLPYFPAEKQAPFASLCNHLHRVGGFFFTLTSSTLVGQALPAPHETWLTFAAFDHLTVVVRNQAKIDPTSKLATLLRRRMHFLELFSRVAMSSACDWQLSMEHRRHEISKDPLKFNWRNVLRKITGDTWAATQSQRAIAALRFSHPRFLIQWDHDPIPDNFPEMLEIFLMGVVTQTSDDPSLMDEALRGLLAVEEKKTGPTHRVVELGLAFYGGRVTTSLLFSIVEVLERFGEAQRKLEATAKIEFRVTALMFSELCTIAGSALEHLGELVRGSENLHINEIKIVRLGIVEDLSLQRCISDLIVPAASPASQSSKKLRLSVEKECKPLASVGATVRYDTSLQEIATTYTAADMDGVAAWLAFGFFHADSTSTVDTVRLLMPGHVDYDERRAPYAVCSPRFVEIFRRVLSRVVSPEDLAPLEAKTAKSMKRKRGDQQVESPLDEHPMRSDKRVIVEVKANTKARRQPLTTSTVVATLAEDTDNAEEIVIKEFQVVRQLRGWLAVVVPGFGAGWIARKAVVKEFTLPTKVSEAMATSSTVKSFAWMGGSLPAEPEFKQQHADAVMELLALMGGHLEALHLPHMALHNQHVAPIVERCPRLKELNLFGNKLTDIAPLVHAYEQGTCGVSSLSVAQHGEAHDRVAQQCATILKLCNQEMTPTVKRPALERLVLRLTPFDYDRIEFYLSDVIPLVYKTILKDPKLEYVRIHCDTDDYSHLIMEMDRLKKEAQAKMAVAAEAPPSARASDSAKIEAEVLIADGLRSRPLPVAAKLAMISVVHHASTQKSALSGMDGGVLANIFDLARTSHPRVVDIAADQIYI